MATNIFFVALDIPALSINLEYLRIHLDTFSDNFGNYSEEQREVQPGSKSDGGMVSRLLRSSYDGRLLLGLKKILLQRKL